MPTEYRVLWDGTGAVSIIVTDMNSAIELAQKLRELTLKDERTQSPRSEDQPDAT